jgi:nicotinate-nucleotide pyrophosphorylase (carboxylating)
MNRKRLLDTAYRRDKALTVSSNEYLKWLMRFTTEAVREDLRKPGDITTESVLRKDPKVGARITAKKDGTVAGIEEAVWFYRQYGIGVKSLKNDGERVSAGEGVLILEGEESALLETERTGLNLLQRMSGIATLTNELVVKARPMLVAATRKTQWGSLDNKAVAVGGGGTHRLGLWESILIKENHLEALSKEGSFDVIEEALGRAWKNRRKAVFIEIEVRNFAEAMKAAETFVSLMDRDKAEKPCIIMLDNFPPEHAMKTVNALKKKGYHERILVEASGNITPDNITRYRDAGVDVVSMGYLTHSPKALDMSQLIEME